MHFESRKLPITFAALTLLPGCGVDHMGNQDTSALADDIGSARLEVVRHQDAITGAATLTDVPPETDRHERAIGDLVDTMDASMGGMMSHCSGSGMGTMHNRIGRIGSEMQSDRAAMLNAGTLAVAREECAAHTHRMDGMLDDMQQSLGNIGCMMGH